MRDRFGFAFHLPVLGDDGVSQRRQHGASAPAGLGVLKDPAAFFRHGVSGDGLALLSADELAHYRDRVAGMAPADLLAWLHRDAEA